GVLQTERCPEALRTLHGDHDQLKPWSSRSRSLLRTSSLAGPDISKSMTLAPQPPMLESTIVGVGGWCALPTSVAPTVVRISVTAVAVSRAVESPRAGACASAKV